jgi:hypothetical protein
MRAPAPLEEIVMVNVDLGQARRLAKELLLQRGDLRPSDPELRDSLLDAGIPLDARGFEGGTALHLEAGVSEFAGTPLAWLAWGSHELPGASERVDGYVGAATALLGAGARVSPELIELAAEDVAAVFVR